MINTKYGYIDEQQYESYKKHIRSSFYWLIQYSDPNTKDNYPTVNLQQYITLLQKELNGFNSLMLCPKEMVSIMSTLESALIDIENNTFNFKIYRKLFLDAGDLSVNIKVGDNSDYSRNE